MANSKKPVARHTDASYLKQQEANLTCLLEQIGPGNARARILLQLRHTRCCIAAAADHAAI